MPASKQVRFSISQGLKRWHRFKRQLTRRGLNKRGQNRAISNYKAHRYGIRLNRERVKRQNIARTKKIKRFKSFRPSKRLKTPAKGVKKKSKKTDARRKEFSIWKYYDGFTLYRRKFWSRGEIATESAKRIVIDEYDYSYIIKNIPKGFDFYSLQIKVDYRKGAATWKTSTSGIIGYKSYENFILDFHKWLRVAVASIMGRMAGRLHYPKFILKSVTIIGWRKRN